MAARNRNFANPTSDQWGLFSVILASCISARFSIGGGVRKKEGEAGSNHVLSGGHL